MGKKTGKQRDVPDYAGERVSSREDVQERRPGSFSSRNQREASTTPSESLNDATSAMGLGSQRNPLLDTEWQAMTSSMQPAVQTQAASLPYAGPRSISARGTGDQIGGRGQGFISSSLTGPHVTETMGQVDVAAFLHAQGTGRQIEGVASRESASAASGVARMSGASSQSSNQQEALRSSTVAQQHQVPPFASASFGNPSRQLQTSLGASLLPPSADYQSALLRAAAGSALFPGLSQRGQQVSTPFFGTGLPTNIAGIGQPPFFGAPPLSMSQGLTPQILDPSRFPSLKGGRKAAPQSSIALPSEARGKRPVDAHPALTGVARGILEPFPERLHRLLTEVESAGHSNIVSFTDDGKAFKILKPDEFFHKIVPIYFNQTKLSSFKRQLNLYGFELITHGKAKGGYYHKYFLRDEPDLARQIRRTDNKYVFDKGLYLKEKKQRRHGAPSAPDFYSMPPILSSEEAERRLAEIRSSGEEAKMETSTAATSSESGAPVTTKRSTRRKKRKSTDEDNRDTKKPSSSESA